MNLNWSGKKVKAKNLLGYFEINSVFRTSADGFFPDLSCAYNMVRVIDGKILEKWVAKGSKNYFELAGGSSYLGWNCSECKKEIQGKSTLVRVSARFELSGVYCIHKSHNIQHFLSERLEKFLCHVEVNENMWHGNTEFGCEATLNL